MHNLNVFQSAHLEHNCKKRLNEAARRSWLYTDPQQDTEGQRLIKGCCTWSSPGHGQKKKVCYTRNSDTTREEHDIPSHPVKINQLLIQKKKKKSDFQHKNWFVVLLQAT